MGFVITLTRAAVLSAVTFVSLRFLGFPPSACWAISLLPLALGALGVLAVFGYSIAGLALVAAAFSTLLPSQYDNAWDFGQKMFSALEAEASKGKSSSSSKSSAQQTTPVAKPTSPTQSTATVAK